MTFGYSEEKQDNIVYAVYSKLNNTYLFDYFVDEDTANRKEKLGYKVVRIKFPRTLLNDHNLELLIKSNIPESQPKLDNLKLDVLEGVVY